ncbi:MAG: aspartate aminotransferase family protein [candidate division KSB1 bacterium]|nr:aspartate aminotransferase family protein [candidate division KSB1 bacterium]
MDKHALIQRENEALLHTYSRPEVVFTHGNGVYLYDSDGREYLDCVAGIAVCAFGHADERSCQVLREQSEQLWHCSNLYHTQPQVELAEFMVHHTFADKVFFCNSGTEAVEAAIKFARKWGRVKKHIGSPNIVCMRRGFHGRTLGALSATGKAALQKDFEPMCPGFRFADFDNADTVALAADDNTCAVIVEPVQGEGGIYPADELFIRALRKLCDERGMLLIFDEIQCGFGRTGTFTAYESYNTVPDILTAAKPIANGLPLGAVLMSQDVADPIEPGDHGTTFGGGPLVSAVARDVLERIAAPGFLQQVRENGAYFQERLRELQSRRSEIVQVRGRGLMIGVEIHIEPKTLIDACLQQGLLICKTGGQAIRFLPPLIIDQEQINTAVEKFENALETSTEEL